MLTDAGFTYKGSTLIDPKGNPVNLDIHVISGWSDWVASNQIITKNLQAIGHQLEREARAGLELVVSERVGDEEPDPALADRLAGLAVRLLPKQPLAAEVHAVRPGRHEHRQLGAHLHAKATALLNQWKASLDPKKQQPLLTQVANIFLQTQPIIPLFVGPRWSTYSTKYFHCFSSPKNFYGDPIFSTAPDNVLLFTRICPGGKAGA